jgi:N-acetylglucosaminyl-diphospho-decaprenol L-rhamnosyltransferase
MRTSILPVPELTVVTVLYNSADVIEECLRALPADVEVVVVDNCSVDGGAARAARARPDAKIVRSSRNLGFGGGCNLGWREGTRPYVAFINPDARVGPGALETLVERLRPEPHAIVGPVMRDERGGLRRCKRRASLRWDVIGLLPSSERWAPQRWGDRLDDGDLLHTQGGVVDQLEGACFVVSRADLDAIGGFDEDLFLYDEEESLAVRLRALGGRAIYEPAAAVEHSGQHSTSRIGAVATRHMYRSRVLLYRKRDGTVRGLLAATLLASAAIVSMPAAVVNTVLRRPTTLTLARVWWVLRGIAAGVATRPAAEIAYPHRRRPPIDARAEAS